MFNSTVTATHSLELIPVTSISYFAHMGSTADIETTTMPIKAGAIPGTILATSTDSDGGKSKKITYHRAPLCMETIQELNCLLSSLLVAVYTDPAGNRRVCGSPAFPLRLSFRVDEGRYECTLTGRTDSEDPEAVLHLPE